MRLRLNSSTLLSAEKHCIAWWEGKSRENQQKEREKEEEARQRNYYTYYYYKGKSIRRVLPLSPTEHELT